MREIREEGVKPLIKHLEFRSIDPLVVRVTDGPRYHRRAMCEPVFSTIKHMLSDPCVREPGTVSFGKF